MSSPNLTGRNFPGQGQRSLSDRRIRQGQYSPPAQEKQNMSLGEFLTNNAVRGDLPQKRRHLVTINKPVSVWEDPNTARENYRRTLTELHDKNAPLAFAFLAEQKIENVCEFLDTYLADEPARRDLASAGPQVDPRFLNALLVELGKLKTLRSGLETAQHALNHLPPDVERCLMEKTLKDALRDENIGMPEEAQRNMVDFVLRDQKPWQMPIANYLIPDELYPAADARVAQQATIGAVLRDLQAAEDAHYEANRG